MPQLAYLDTSAVAKDTRTYDLDFDILESKEIIAEVLIPTDAVIKYLPESVAEDSPWCNFVAEYHYKNNTLYFRQKIELKRNVISQAEYGAFKDFLERLSKKVKQRVVLEKER